MPRTKVAVDRTIAASGRLVLGDASPRAISYWMVHLVGSGFTGTVSPEGRALGSDAAWAGVAYKDMGDGDTKTADLTGTSIILVEATGLDLSLDIAVSGGSVRVLAQPLAG